MKCVVNIKGNPITKVFLSYRLEMNYRAFAIRLFCVEPLSVVFLQIFLSFSFIFFHFCVCVSCCSSSPATLPAAVSPPPPPSSVWRSVAFHFAPPVTVSALLSSFLTPYAFFARMPTVRDRGGGVGRGFLINRATL